MAETEQLVVALEARINQFEKAFNRASQTASRNFSAIENRARQSARKLESSLNSSVASINRTLGAIGVGVGLNEITRLADGYTKFTNQLKVAGLEGNKLKLLDMALDAVWESIFGPSRGNNFFSSLGKALTPQTRPAATAPAVVPDVASPAVKSISQATEQTFAAPVGKVERAALPPVSQIAAGLRGTISPEVVKPDVQEATKSFAKNITLSPKEITDLKKTLFTEWVPKQGDMQGKGIIDTILNRKASGHWGDSVTDVVNARKQFSAIAGGQPWAPGKIARSVDDIPDSVLLRGRGKMASDLVNNYLPERAAGLPSSVGDNLNYANRAASTPNNWGWIDALQGPKFGAHQHGTTADLQRFRPGDFGVGLPKETVPPGLDMTTTGSVAKHAEAIQQQIEAQQRLAQQMAATQQATTAMQAPIQNIGQAATQVVPNLGGFGQGVNSLLERFRF